MRQTISGLVAAVAVMAAAPAMACGYDGCGGLAHQQLAEPVPQYYYVNQGPTFTGPGSWAPVPSYQESAVSGYNADRRPYYYGYTGGPYANATNHYYDGAGIEGPAVYIYRPRHGYRPWRPRTGSYHAPRRDY